MTLFEGKGVSIDFGGLRAVHNLDVQIHDGDLFGLIGPNGAGKTTCFNIMTGFLRPTSGSLLYKGESLFGLKPYQIAERGIVRTFQIASLFNNLSTEENIVVGRYLKTKGNVFGSIIRSRRYREEQAKIREKAREILDFVGMGEQKDVMAKTLPFGDQRKLEIAIAMATEPEFLLLDEPAAGMSPDESNKLMALIRSIRKMGITILIVEHNMRVVMELCNRILVLNHGVRIAEGTPEEIANNSEVVTAYLGRGH